MDDIDGTKIFNRYLLMDMMHCDFNKHFGSAD